MARGCGGWPGVWVTTVDEVYDVNDFEVVVPEDGVGVDEKS